jgi:ABC-type thiamin/hydroxymethylpyrimidine transport system permease subunit
MTGSLMKKRYFSLFQLCFLAMMGALVYVLKTFIRSPMSLPGHTAVFWVLPIVVGVGLVRKFGSATYVGVIAGLLIGFIGMADTGPFKFLEYFVMGLTIDILAVVFRGHLDNVIVGFIIGSAGSLSKLFVNYNVSIMLGLSSSNLILVGIGLASISTCIFGGLGGVFSALVLRVCFRAHVTFQFSGTLKTNLAARE